MKCAHMNHVNSCLVLPCLRVCTSNSNSHSGVLLTFMCFPLICGGRIIYIVVNFGCSWVPDCYSDSPHLLSAVSTVIGQFLSSLKSRTVFRKLHLARAWLAAERCFPWRRLRPLFRSSPLPFVICITAQLQKTGKYTSFEDRLWCIALLIFSLSHCNILDE